MSHRRSISEGAKSRGWLGKMQHGFWKYYVYGLNSKENGAYHAGRVREGSYYVLLFPVSPPPPPLSLSHTHTLIFSLSVFLSLSLSLSLSFSLSLSLSFSLSLSLL